MSTIKLIGKIKNPVKNTIDDSPGDDESRMKQQTEIAELAIEDIYQKMEQKEHALELPDTYIGSIEMHEELMWVIDDNYHEDPRSQQSSISGENTSQNGSVDGQDDNGNGETRMVMRKIRYVPGLYKIYDEVLVNAMDHWTRMEELIRKQELIKAGKMEETPEVKLTMKFRPVKNLKVWIDQDNNQISIQNDGDGIPVAIHEEYQV